MTDPNVTKLLCLLVDHAFYGVTHPETRYIASKALDAIHAAAEKPAEKPAEAAPDRVWGTCADCPVDPSGKQHPRYCQYVDRYDHQIEWSDKPLPHRARSVHAPSAPVAPALPWVVRRKSDGQVFAAFLWEGGADMYFSRIVTPDEFEIVEVAAAPTVAAVAFDAKGDAAGPGWEAESFALESPRRVSVSIDLRPGEDAGETLAKALAAVGRGP